MRAVIEIFNFLGYLAFVSYKPALVFNKRCTMKWGFEKKGVCVHESGKLQGKSIDSRIGY